MLDSCIDVKFLSPLLPRDLKFYVDVDKVKRRTYIVDLDQNNVSSTSSPFVATLRSASEVGNVEADRIGAGDRIAT